MSNLAHLLAISGLHMGLLAGFVFATVRLALSLWQPWALRLPVKKIAAFCAIVAATGYLMLSGASIATQRAFIMAAVALVAVMLDRRAFSMRSVAIAALLVLGLEPSSLLSPGFQMSFSATTALVLVFTNLRRLPDYRGSRWINPVLNVTLSSLVAGLATAPIAAAHFNQWAAYGLIANILAVPTMGVIVIPGAVLAAVFAPIGLHELGLEVMGLGLKWILFVADWVSSLDNARIPIMAPPSRVLCLIGFAGSWFALWQGWLRILGVLAMGASVLLWSQSARPDVIISSDGRIVGVMSTEGRILSKKRGQGFVVERWLENDGDTVGQAAAFQRGLEASGAQQMHGKFETEASGMTILHFQGKKGDRLPKGCEPDDILISDHPILQSLPCLRFDLSRLNSTGAVSITFVEDGLAIETVAKRRGQRLWSPPAQQNSDLDQ